MILSQTLDNKISALLRAENDKRDAEHKRSGKLSASKLGWPVQFQVLYALGVPQKPFDDFTLRKFRRGNHCEEWITAYLPVVEVQKQVEYRNVTGLIDAVVDTKEWDFNVGVIPLEVKSVSSAKFNRIKKRKEPDRNHFLQADLYALATGSPKFGICYIDSDAYRTRLTLHDTVDYKAEVDGIIDRFNEAMKSGIIPPIGEVDKDDAWILNDKYCPFEGDFAGKTFEQVSLMYCDYK